MFPSITIPGERQTLYDTILFQNPLQSATAGEFALRFYYQSDNVDRNRNELKIYINHCVKNNTLEMSNLSRVYSQLKQSASNANDKNLKRFIRNYSKEIDCYIELHRLDQRITDLESNHDQIRDGQLQIGYQIVETIQLQQQLRFNLMESNETVNRVQILESRLLSKKPILILAGVIMGVAIIAIVGAVLVFMADVDARNNP